MSILIKGLDIPKSEHERITVQIGSDGGVYLVTDFELKAEVYKFNAVEVPEPHGRLIDADKYLNKVKYEAEGMSDDYGNVFIGYTDWVLGKEPAIIEAEGQDHE